MVFEHEGDHASQWAAISSIAAKIGCTPETLRGWVRQAERDQGKRPRTEEADIRGVRTPLYSEEGCCDDDLRPERGKHRCCG